MTTSIALGRDDVVVGVDTHKGEHVAVGLNGLGGHLGERTITANPAGYTELLAWADSLGAVAVFGVEGTGSYGSGLARFLRRHGLDQQRRPVAQVSARLRGIAPLAARRHDQCSRSGILPPTNGSLVLMAMPVRDPT